MYQMQNYQLPPNWEKKWDPNQRRFFYINHATKTTQWDPPQQQQQANFKHPQAQSQGAYTGFNNAQPMSAKTTSLIEADPAKVKILVDQYKNLTNDVAEALLKTKNNKLYEAKTELKSMGYVYKKKEPVKPEVVTADEQKVNKILHEYKNVSKDLVEALLIRVNNNLDEAMEVVKIMGFKQVGESSSTSDFESSSDVSSDEVIEADPAKVKDIVARYKNVDVSVVEALMRISNNDVASCEKELCDRGYQLKPKPKQLFVSVLVREFDGLSEEVAKEVLVDKSNNLTDARNSLLSMHYILKKDKPKPKQIKKPTPIKITPQKIPAKTTQTNKTKQPTVKTPTKIYTPSPTPKSPPLKTMEKSSNMSRSKENVKVTKPIIQRSKNASGPSPSNALGPNSNLLLKQRVLCQGPNRNLVSGPQHLNRHGHNPGNLCSKELKLANGPAGINFGSTARIAHV